MENRSKLIVSQGNDLLEGAYNISRDEIRFLFLALTKIDSKVPQPDGLYTLYPAEFEKMYGVNKAHIHQSLKNAASSLGKKPIYTYEYNEKKKRVDKVERFWFSSIRYDESGVGADVTVRFSQDVAMYLYELKKEFTQLKIDVIAKLTDSPFALRLYSWLIKYKNLSRCMNSDKVITTDAIDIEWMKERAGLIGKYKEYKFFKRDILEPAVNVINARTDISVLWKPIKQGRNIVAIKFSYVEEKSGVGCKPLRPRLPRRPKAIKGSAMEGEWASKCISVMSEFKKLLIAYDPNEKIAVSDLKKWVHWCEIIGDKYQMKIINSEIKERTK
ncbi:TPA: replication initiation protein [Yersinia enterocolitica]